MICPACGFRDTEEGEHRCARCGRRLDGPRPVTSPSGGAAPAPAPWKQEVAQRLERFKYKRALQQRLFGDPPPDNPADTVPPPDLNKKVIPFEEIGAENIEPIIVEPPPVRRFRPRRTYAPLPPVAAEPSAGPEPAAGCAVTPVGIRALAGALDVAVTLAAAGVFFGIFTLLGGAAPSTPKGLVWMALAAACLMGFYFFAWICYGSETPGLQWMGLCVLDYEGRSPRPGPRLVRAVGVLLSAAALGLGYLWALADEETLTWHDRMSKTFVTRDPLARRALGSGR